MQKAKTSLHSINFTDRCNTSMSLTKVKTSLESRNYNIIVL